MDLELANMLQRCRGKIRLIVLGASAGGIEAFRTVLQDLPSDYPIPVVAVLHLRPDQPSLLVGYFSEHLHLRVVEPDDKQRLEPGHLYLAPPNYHLLVESDLTLAMSIDPPVYFSRPSIDVLFESAAESCGEGVLAIAMTAASWDGVAGMKRVKELGGTTAVEDPETAQTPVLPRAVLDQANPHYCGSLLDLSRLLAGLGSERDF